MQNLKRPQNNVCVFGIQEIKIVSYLNASKHAAILYLENVKKYPNETRRLHGENLSGVQFSYDWI